MLAAIVLALTFSVGCSQPPAPQPLVILRLAGSTSMQPLVRALASAYSERHKNASFEFTAVGSAGGLELLRRGQVDLALVSRPLQPEEELDTSTGKPNLVSTVIAWDAIAIIVHQNNPVRQVSSYQLRSVFEGQTLNWGDLGSPAGDIVVVSREDGSGTRTTFEQLVMRGHAVTSTALVMPGSEALVRLVASTPACIGYVSAGWLGIGVAALALDGIGPTPSSIEQATYPLVRPFLLVYHDRPPSGTAGFLAFVASPAGQAIVRTNYGSSASRRP
jgi:phosphate transport system substrate-binding protein